jgi:hypothetical protein
MPHFILTNMLSYMTLSIIEKNGWDSSRGGPYQLSTLFQEQKVIFAITPAEKLTNFEKLLLPFDELTWKLLIGTFCVAFLAIFFANVKSKFFRNLVLGFKVNSPALNVIGSFFGISQTKVPKRNFSRIILMNFVLFCLVMRTAYQGVLFEMVATDMRKKLPEKIEELFEKNYTIHCLSQHGVCVFLQEKFDVLKR